MILKKEKMIDLYEKMLRIRMVQEKIADIFPQEPRKIRCPVHLYIGHEAIAVGVCENLKEDDLVFGYYRGHGHYLAKGGDLKALFAELFGKETGCSKGRGGSMHLVDIDKGFMGTSAIVAGPIPIAVGAALAFKIKKEPKVVVSFFGDGACEEGVWHESLNFASLKKLPIIFVCENNQYAVKSHILNRQPLDNIYKRAKNYGILSEKINGNNILEVFDVAMDAIEYAREGMGPIFIEARTYRLRQHVENTFFSKDLFEGRPDKEFKKALKKCPIEFFRNFLLKEKILKEIDLDEIKRKIELEISEAVEFAEKSSFPETLS